MVAVETVIQELKLQAKLVTTPEEIAQVRERGREAGREGGREAERKEEEEGGDGKCCLSRYVSM